MTPTAVLDVLHPDAPDAEPTRGADTASPRAIDLGGTVRSRTAAESLAYVGTLYERFGITRLADVTGMDSLGVPVAMCVRPNARHISVSQGKGLEIDLAMVSAAMESIEMHHAEHPPAPVTTTPWSELDQPAVRPTRFELGNRFIDARDHTSLGWVEAAELVSRSTVLVPQALVDLDSTRSHPDTGMFAVSSNGLASGNCLIEAVLHGLYEVIERDADLRFGLMSAAEQEARRLALVNIGVAHLDELIERLSSDASTRLDAWDITSSVGVPAYRVTLRDNDTWRNLGSFVGSGCHRSPVIALSRALTEAAQTRLTLIAGSRDDVFPSHYERRKATIGPTLLPGPVTFSPQLSATASPAASSIDGPPSFDHDLAAVLDALSRAGSNQVLVVDQTEPDLDIAVVKVIVPTLRMRRLEP